MESYHEIYAREILEGISPNCGIEKTFSDRRGREVKVPQIKGKCFPKKLKYWLNTCALVFLKHVRVCFTQFQYEALWQTPWGRTHISGVRGKASWEGWEGRNILNCEGRGRGVPYCMCIPAVVYQVRVRFQWPCRGLGHHSIMPCRGLGHL